MSEVIKRRLLAPPPPTPAASHCSRLGMWIFLATEVMFFGPVFWGYLVQRQAASQAFAQAAALTDIKIGTVNTLVLLTSSLSMALAVERTRHGAASGARRMLMATAILGLVFLALKGVEYHDDWHRHLIPGPYFHASGVSDQAGAQIFFFTYFFATLLHALHLTIGIVLTCIMAYRLRAPGASMAAWPACAGSGPPIAPGLARSAEVTGLYWHFVDIVWIFLFPMLYLGGRT